MAGMIGKRNQRRQYDDCDQCSSKSAPHPQGSVTAAVRECQEKSGQAASSAFLPGTKKLCEFLRNCNLRPTSPY